jgi:hypothetical protein
MTAPLLLVFVLLVSGEDFLLYSVNRGEGFTAQLLVLTRVLALLDRVIEQRSANRSDVPLSLVMPPVCGRLVHGGDGSDTAYRMSDVIDLAHLQRSVPGLHRVVDLHEHGGAVDAAMHLQLRSRTDYKAMHFRALDVCDEESQLDVQLTHLCWPLRVASLQCYDAFVDADYAPLHESLLRLWRGDDALVPDCDASRRDRSVALLRAETLSWGMVWFSERLDRALVALRPSPRLKQLADEALAALREQRECSTNVCLRQWATGASVAHCARLTVGIHWRRRDFASAHGSTTPSAKTLARQLAQLLDAMSSDACVFLMTDADGHDRLALLNALTELAWPTHRLVALHDDAQATLLPVARLEIEKEIMIVASESFYGTPPSSVSLWISKKRVSVSKRDESTNHNLDAHVH